jgi:hypothetical protein
MRKQHVHQVFWSASHVCLLASIQMIALPIQSAYLGANSILLLRVFDTNTHQRVLPLIYDHQLHSRPSFVRFCISSPSQGLVLKTCQVSCSEVSHQSNLSFAMPDNKVDFHRKEFENIVDNLTEALDFSKTIGAESGTAFEIGGNRSVVGEVDLYTR